MKRLYIILGSLALVLVFSLALFGCTQTQPTTSPPTAAPTTTAATIPPTTTRPPTTTPPPPSASLVASVQPESCATCHQDQGAKHQAAYDELYQDGVVKVSDITYSFTSSPKDTVKVTFKMTKNGASFSARDADALSIGWVPYNGKTFETPVRVSFAGTLSYDAATGVSTSTLVEKDLGTTGYLDLTDVSRVNGVLAVYGRDETIGTLPGTRVTQNRYPFANLIKTGTTVDYVSTANVKGCEKCHTVPYLKHSYIYGQVNKDAATDFLTCKVCHSDNGAGGHFEWQLIVDDPKTAEAYVEHGAKLTPEQTAKYAYTTRLMNDVHMSHAMEFPYPQSMANCVTCHEGKLDKILTDANFKVQTCKSCHAVTGSKEYGTDTLALKTILPSLHSGMDLNTVDCTGCHKAGGSAAVFSKIHTGYDNQIYTTAGKRYSDAIKVTIDSASLSGNVLNIKFSATENPDLPGVDATKIVPTLLVGLYGYDTKDYLIGPHERLTDDNGDKVIDSKDSRTLEVAIGTNHPRIKTVSASGGKWEVTADLSAWASLISSNITKRAEIGIIPTLKDSDNVTVALNAPSRTFDLKKNAFDDKFYSPIVKEVNGCNNCHDALATTFHSPDRGGNVVVCRLCHTPKSGGGHLEVQSRSIDSYVHAIHAMQDFDIGSINFADPVAAMHYEDHVSFPFPTHASTNCEACHVTGKYNVPDQSKSLPGILSGTSELKGIDRDLPKVSAVVTGPASRACGGCHRAVLINEDDANGFASFLQHTKNGGYLIADGTEGQTAATILEKTIEKIMNYFK